MPVAFEVADAQGLPLHLGQEVWIKATVTNIGNTERVELTVDRTEPFGLNCKSLNPPFLKPGQDVISNHTARRGELISIEGDTATVHFQNAERFSVVRLADLRAAA